MFELQTTANRRRRRDVSWAIMGMLCISHGTLTSSSRARLPSADAGSALRFSAIANGATDWKMLTQCRFHSREEQTRRMG